MRQKIQHDDIDSAPAVIEHNPPQRSFVQAIGLAPGTAVLAIGTDILLFGGDLVSMGLLVPFSLLAAAALGFVTYKLQRGWGDGHDAALVKAVVIALITAIPVPVTPLLAGPAGLVGLIKSFRGR
jgi:hypothetical protein